MKKTMITAIRIEHPSDGIGIFMQKDRESLSVHNFLKSVSVRHVQNFPDIKDEIGYEVYKSYFCAYKTIEQLNDWILPDEMTEIINKGYKIYLLDLTEAKVTDFQVIFKKEHILQQKDITSIFRVKKKKKN